VRLFDRTSRRVRLTEAGRVFLPEARATIEQAARAARAAQLAHRGETGRLALGFSTSVPFVSQVMDALARYRRHYPEVDLELYEMARDEQIAGIERGTLDIGILRSFLAPELPPSLHSWQLQEDGMVLVMRRDHRLAGLPRDPGLADLEGEALIMFGAINGAGFNEHLIAQCEKLGFHPNIAMEPESFVTLLGLTAAGFGVTILSRALARLNFDTLTSRPLDVDFTSQLRVIQQAAPSPTTSRFLDMIAGADPGASAAV
jgi:DNA-binding transcriptional LysR family regulator